MGTRGRWSVASFLTILINVAWFATAAVLVIGAALVLFNANVAFRVDANGPSIEAGPHVTMSIPVSLRVDRDTHRVEAPSLGIQSAQLDDLQGVLKFPPVKGPFFFVTLALVFGWIVLGLWVLSQLRGLVRTLRDGRPFVPANAARVRRIAWAVIAGELARAAFVYFEGRYAMSHFSAAGLVFDVRPHVDVFTIVNGLIILAIAEVFRAGTRLDEDQSLTI